MAQPKNNQKGRAGETNLLKTEQGRMILDVAMLGFLKHGYHGFSIKDIGAKTGFSKGSLYHYINSKACLAFGALETLKARFHEISYGPEKKRLYSLKDGKMVALLPIILLESDIAEIKVGVTRYYKDWSEHFLACGDRRDDTFKNFDETSNHYSFWAWFGFWCMAHTGALPISNFDEMNQGGEDVPC